MQPASDDAATGDPTHAPGVYVRDTGSARGRGVFAARRFAAGETVECAPVLLFDGRFEQIPGELRRVLFNWSVLSGEAGGHCLALGYGSLYNHANPANMRYEADGARRVLRFVAVRPVDAGEELTINYNGLAGLHESETDHWFERHGVQLLDDAAPTER